MRLRFADFAFDSDTREIFRGGKPVHVSPKAFALLEALIEKRPKAISKDELHRRLWPETFVSEANLPNLVAWALAGEPRGNDARMLELLEPYRGRRALVVRLLELSGVRAPRYGPRLAPRRIEAI